MGVELTLVMLAAPAATAGAICVDRARGTLAHMLATDLSDPEIVLGKLAARLLPVLGYDFGEFAGTSRSQHPHGAVYHVMARGNAWQKIVRDDADRRRLIDGLGAEMIDDESYY